MAHLLQSMAYVGETPWHNLGQQLEPKQPIEVWAREAGMDGPSGPPLFATWPRTRRASPSSPR